jgi:hypothetical protein
MRPLLLIAGLLTVSACTTAPSPLEPSYGSSEALARAVMDGFATGDLEGLRRFALTEQEFRERVWPELPASRPERNLPFSYVWGDLKQKSDATLANLFARYRGRQLEFVSVRFSGLTPYQSFIVHRESIFTVRDTPEGSPTDVRLCGSMIEQGGRWKVFSYVVDD